jgi:hypothetical protein
VQRAARDRGDGARAYDDVKAERLGVEAERAIDVGRLVPDDRGAGLGDEGLGHGEPRGRLLEPYPRLA